MKGLYQCRTAVDDIMHKPKAIKLVLGNGLNDFMLAILDTENKELIIRYIGKY